MSNILKSVIDFKALIFLIKQIYRIVRRYAFFTSKSFGHSIKIYNYDWDGTYDVTRHWLYQFINQRQILKKDKSLSIYSVNGNRMSFKLDFSDFRIFYTVENVHVPESYWSKYEDLMLSERSISLSLGFDYIAHPKYLRFPYWLMKNFSVNETLESINLKLLTFSSQNYKERAKFCAFICRQDYFGDRALLANLVGQIEAINFPGAFRFNDGELQEVYNDDKIEYLKKFKFNLCPENSNTDGYVTEKIFDSIKAGCIPIYWGAGNKPEIDILNQDRILFLDVNGDNQATLDFIKILNNDAVAYESFVSQPAFNDYAGDVIYNYFERLDKRLRDVLS